MWRVHKPPRFILENDKLLFRYEKQSNSTRTTVSPCTLKHRTDLTAKASSWKSIHITYLSIITLFSSTLLLTPHHSQLNRVVSTCNGHLSQITKIPKIATRQKTESEIQVESNWLFYLCFVRNVNNNKRYRRSFRRPWRRVSRRRSMMVSSFPSVSTSAKTVLSRRRSRFRLWINQPPPTPTFPRLPWFMPSFMTLRLSTIPIYPATSLTCTAGVILLLSFLSKWIASIWPSIVIWIPLLFGFPDPGGSTVSWGANLVIVG